MLCSKIKFSASTTSIYSTRFTIVRITFSSRPLTLRFSKTPRIWTSGQMGCSRVLREIQMGALVAKEVPSSTASITICTREVEQSNLISSAKALATRICPLITQNSPSCASASRKAHPVRERALQPVSDLLSYRQKRSLVAQRILLCTQTLLRSRPWKTAPLHNSTRVGWRASRQVLQSRSAPC